MPILNIITNQPTGLQGVTPQFIYIDTTDTTAQVTAAGYLDHTKNDGFNYSNNQLAIVSTGTKPNQDVDIYNVSVSAAGVVTLIANINPGSVLLPVVANHLAVFTNVAGQIGDPAGTAIHGGSIQAGIAGTLGSWIAYGAASGGALDFLTTTYLTSGGNRGLTITNVAMGQATTMTLPDPGNANGRYLVGATATPFTNGNILIASGTGGVVADGGVAPAALQRTANIIAAKTANIGGGGAGPITVAVAGLTAASVVVATISTSSNTVAVAKTTAGVAGFDILFTADPGAACVVNYTAFVAPQ